MSARPRILFYFLHLLGVGHVYRAKRLIEGFVCAGLDVDVIYGGAPVPGITFETQSVRYLPPIKAADSAYSSYLDEDGNRLEKPYQDRRTAILLDIFEGLSPDLILTEAFPFGRRMVRHELGALLAVAAARSNPPLIVSSVRDILQEGRKPGRAEETRDWIQHHFDHVLVHSDPNIIRLDETYPLVEDIADKLSYTGFVVEPERISATTAVEAYDVIASVGGGAFGGPLMEIVLQAAKSRTDMTWCLATGPNMPEVSVDRLQQEKPSHVTIKTRIEGLAAHLAQARLSISQCRYNTAMDALSAHRAGQNRAVFVPYDTQGQSEQLRRAELLQRAGYAISLPQSALTAETLLEAIDRAMVLPKVEQDIDFEGVDNTARLISSWLEAR